MPEETTQGQGGDHAAAAAVPAPTTAMYPTGRLHSTIKDDMDSSFMSETHDSKPASDKGSTDPGTANNIQGESGKEKGGEGDEGTPKTTDKDTKPDTDEFSEEQRFDKNPIFQRLNKDNRKLRDELLEIKGALQAVMNLKGGGKEAAAGEEGTDFNIAEMDPEDIRTAILEGDPRSFLGKLTWQIKKELRDEMTNESQATSLEEARRTDYLEHAKENSDFQEMWESGELQDYMKKHPGYNAIGAHLKLTEEKRWKPKIEEAVAKAVKEAREEERRNAGVRLQGSTVLPVSTGVPREGENPEDAILKDTSKAGGRANAVMRWLDAKKARR